MTFNKLECTVDTRGFVNSNYDCSQANYSIDLRCRAVDGQSISDWVFGVHHIQKKKYSNYRKEKKTSRQKKRSNHVSAKRQLTMKAWDRQNKTVM